TMPFRTRMMNFWRNLFYRKHVERDLTEELQSYIDELTDRKRQAGLSPQDAHEAAIAELGGIDRIKDLVRQQRIGFADLKMAGVLVGGAIVAFVSGASAAIGVAKWGKPSAPAPKPLPMLEGRIVDKNTGEPVSYVEIGLEPYPALRRHTYTASDGTFRFGTP